MAAEDDDWETVHEPAPAGAAAPADDGWEDIDTTADAGPAGRRATAGMPPEPAPPSDEALGLDQGPRAVFAHGTQQGQPAPPGALIYPGGEPRQPGFNDTDMAGDPMARMVASGVVAGGAGKLVQGAATALGVGATPAAVAGGATAGGTAAKMEGAPGVPVAAMALGGGFAWLGRALSGTSDALYRKYGQDATQRGKTVLRELGPGQVDKTAKAAGITAASTPAEAAQAAKVATQQTGARIGDAYKTIDTSAAEAGVPLPLERVMVRLDKLKRNLSKTTEGEKLGDLVFNKSKEIWSKYSGKRGANTMTAAQLNAEIGELEATGYGGTAATLSPAKASVLSRRTASALNEVLDDHIDAVARKNPVAAEAARHLRENLNPDYRVLKTIAPVLEKQANAEAFKLRFAEQLRQEPGKAIASLPGRALAVPGAVARGVGNVAGNAIEKVAGPAVRASDVALARLMAAMRSGGVTPEVVQYAVQSGVSPVLVQQMLTRQQVAHP